MVERKNGAAPPDGGLERHGPRAGEAEAQGAAPPDKKKVTRKNPVPAQGPAGGSPPADGTDEASARSAPTAPKGRVALIRQYELVERVKAYDPDADEDMLDRAYVFAMKAHGDQTRKSGDPYFSHPLAVAGILTDLRADPATVATALLHDVVEDTERTAEDIRRAFGDEIAHLVAGVTKLSEIEAKGEASRAAENFRKFVMAMADDVRVLLVKLADRLHNMRTLEHHSDPEKRRRIAVETMEIYAPLAGRIGVQRFRDELEDLAFREISPAAFETITARLEELRESTVEGVIDLRLELLKRLDQAGVKAEVHAREKRAYSIWRKMTAKSVGFDELADIYAFRIIVETTDDCYRALGVIHQGWRMIPSEFDDYISASKPNGYKSIHTAVIGPPRKDSSRQKIEIQIRTREMHEAAERGVAAHWQYKDKGAGTKSVEIVGQYDPYETPRRIVEMYQLGEDPDEVLRYAKIELFQDQVFCFTPKGLVVALPKGASALDFAYAVHTDIGDSCVGAKVNGVIAPLRTALKNGDVVEIIRGENAPPPPAEWEQIAQTGRARAALRRRVKRMKHAELAELGRNKAEAMFERAQLEFSKKAVRAALAKFKAKTVEDLLAQVGAGEIGVDDLVEAAYPGASLQVTEELKPAATQPFRPRVAIEGLTPGAPVRMGSCCSPVPGERIVGIRDDDGVVVHSIACERLAADDPPQDRWLDLRWRRGADGVGATAHIVVTVQNEIGALSEVASVIARYGVSIANIRLDNRSPGFVEMAIDLEVKEVRQLANLLAGLRTSKSVVAAERKDAAT